MRSLSLCSSSIALALLASSGHATARVLPASPCPWCDASSTGGPPDTLVVDPRASSATWSAAGAPARHGTVGISSGLLVSRHEVLTTGRFTIDLSNLHDGQPAASFITRGAARVGPARWRVTGDLTLHGVTRPLTFDADVRWPEPGHMVASGAFRVRGTPFGLTLDTSGPAGDELLVNVTLDARRRAAVATAQ